MNDVRTDKGKMEKGAEGREGMSWRRGGRIKRVRGVGSGERDRKIYMEKS